MNDSTPPTRRRTVPLAALVLLAGVVPPATAAVVDPARPASGRPDLTVSTVAEPPPQVAAGRPFTVRARVSNQGRARAGATTVRVYLSRDRSRGRGDLVLAGRGVRALAAGRSVPVGLRVAVPRSATGSFHVVVCVDAAGRVRESDERDNCRASARRVRVTDVLDATLSGTLSLTDSGERADADSTTTWDRSAELRVRMSARGTWRDRFSDLASTYAYEGEEVTELGGSCATTVLREEVGAGPLAWSGDPFTDEIDAYPVKTDLSELRVRVDLGYRSVTTRTSCEGQTQAVSESLDLVSMKLVAVATTPSTTTYRVVDVQAETGTASHWDEVTGRLTLSRN